jgi:phosphoribosylamine---glycine ligase
VLEFNVRFGDPETQVVLPRWEGDVADALASAAAGSLGAAPRFSAAAAVAVVVAAEGYPSSPRTGELIDGIEAAAALDGVQVYAAGVGRDTRGRLVTAGGRVLAVTGMAADAAKARALAYQGVEAINWPGMTYRRDIAERVEDAR